MTTTIMFANNKGGVAKSQVCVQTAAALARRGLDVLVIDMDPQANASRRLGVVFDEATNPIPTISEVLLAASSTEGAGQGAVTPCTWTQGDEGQIPTAEAERIDLIPSRFDLINRADEAAAVGAVRRLKKALAGGWTEAYDVILIDTRPDLGHLVQMPMAVADFVVIPTDATFDGANGAIEVRTFIEKHAEDLGNPNLRIGGVVVTRWRTTNEAQYQLEGLTQEFGDLLWNMRETEMREVTSTDGTTELKEVETFPPGIKELTRFTEADGAAVSLSAYTDERGRTAIAFYEKIADRIASELLPIGERA
ncbi:ParA family protein [Antribacter gilvus]|uniref:ParA family protein n=1 Tax=Antribacter gilvus TaxID=2304675 RepID=UPI000F782336|nr:AAA family ATPase [Antribacter gilvus]